MKTMTALLVAGTCAVGIQQTGGPPAAHNATVQAYEHLATAIIANRNAEDSLVKGILHHHYAMARRSLRASLEAAGADRSTYLESAATHISYIASEGDKPVQAIRQRLLKAGHHHHTDAETQDDYIFVDSGEKKMLFDLARRISQSGRSATDVELRAAQRELTSLFTAVMVPE
ncbi:MAG: hypothetical protein ACYS15_12430 [Planctomycetota bacterium]|jgi:hypothetical protein